jgi:protein-S-isoprenylcysteine O-methyltransferase Ste14
MKTFPRFMKRQYSFHWFLDTWTVKQKWMYVALYVVFFKLGLIPILVISETTSLLSEGSFLSLGLLVILLVLWFAIYQPIINFFFSRDGN